MRFPALIFLAISLQTAGQSILTDVTGNGKTGFDVLPGFLNPPKGYGEVPFYWWQGDTLTRERIQWQLDQLANKRISSLQINYSHRDYGGLTYGLSNPSKPPLFSPEWWNLFKWFSEEAHKRDMTVSLSDYTIGVGQGFAMDEAIKDNPELNGSELKSATYFLSGKVNRSMPQNLLTLNAYKINTDSSVVDGSKRDLMPFAKGGKLSVDLGKSAWKVMEVSSEKVIPSFNPMNPESGKAYIHYFFERFEKALPENGKGMLDFFFSDELNFRLSGNLWDKSFADEFKKRKGYDITPELDKLFLNAGPSTPKIRLDYNDVIVSLSEENFFEPVYQWHQDRGMTFGCDHGGRGRDVTEFGDYFRTQKWNQGPGSDQPRLSKDIIKAKVASSIAHLYGRPRVWLEGFHSSGWGTSSADVADAIFANFVAGYNLLSFHGLYYSTMGGWWEWAPPDNHFRMPYWNQIDPLMNCVQRLSYLMSQGYHNCDIAIIYPTEPVVAGMDGEKSVNFAFGAGEKLYDKGIDFDFIDFESLARSDAGNGTLQVSGEKYKVLIIPSMKAMRFASLKKIEEFRNSGGLVVNLGDFPEATDKSGKNDSETEVLVKTVFSKGENLIQCETPDEVPSAISGRYDEGFRVVSAIKERPYMMHRIIGSRDVYFLYNFTQGSKCFFNARGSVQLWNPWNGEVLSLSELAVPKEKGTELTLPLTSKEVQIIVFDPEKHVSAKVFTGKKVIKEYDLDGKWEFELKPSLDNRWGDFELPATDELLGAQVRELYLTENKGYNGEIVTPDESWKKVSCGFGNQFLKLGALAELPSEQRIQQMHPGNAGEADTIKGKKCTWESYPFSWKQGVEGDYGHQGYHGLKGEMYDNFIRLGDLEDVRMSLKRVPEAEGRYYILATTVIAPQDGEFELLTGETKPVVFYVNNLKSDPAAKKIQLNKGANPIVMVYGKACETYLLFRIPGKPKPPKEQVTMSWYKDYAILPFGYPSPENSGLFTFKSAPGLRTLTFSAYGTVSVWIDGEKYVPEAGKREPDGLTGYKVNVKNSRAESSNVVVQISYQPGYWGAGAIPEYIRQTCGKGEIELGDWSKTDGLKSYSGGAWYRKKITIDEADIENNLQIDLGNLVSSAQLFVNGKNAGIKLAPPWTFDISGIAEKGRNDIEVLVYNTLSNHYTSIPTRYKGSIRAGLIGPVRLKVITDAGKE
jgi:hypothetical protein